MNIEDLLKEIIMLKEENIKLKSQLESYNNSRKSYYEKSVKDKEYIMSKLVYYNRQNIDNQQKIKNNMITNLPDYGNHVEANLLHKKIYFSNRYCVNKHMMIMHKNLFGENIIHSEEVGRGKKRTRKSFLNLF